MRPILVILSFAAFSAFAAGQQVGDGNRNYTIYNQGSLAASPAPVSIPNCLGCNTWSNTYATLDPGAPVVWVLASEGQIGWVTTATNSIDIGPAGIVTLFDGTTAPGPINPFETDAEGSFQIGLNTPESVAGTSVWLAMLHFAATSPDGFWISQTHEVSFDVVNTLGPSQFAVCSGNSLDLGDDDSVLVSLGFGFEFYGATYSQCYVGSNGFITFGSGNLEFTESPAGLAGGPPRIAPWWDDLSPSAGGSVRWAMASFGSSSQFDVCWSGVPEFFFGGSNSFSLRLTRTPAFLGVPEDYDVIFDYGSMTARDGLVGISPGAGVFGVPAVLNPINFSQGPNTLSPSLTAYYELFEPTANPADLYGHRVHIDLDSSGFPTLQN